MAWRIIAGKTPFALETLADNSCAGFVTDPPYCSGGNLVVAKKAPTNAKYGGIAGQQFGGDNMSERQYIRFTAEWISEMFRICYGSTGFIFTDWRMWGALEEAVSMGGARVCDMLVWSKGRGRVKHGGWTNSHELIAHIKSSGDAIQNFYGKPNVLDYKPVPPNKRIHFAQKPNELLIELMRAIVAGPIIDPFAGSGATIQAAMQCARHGIGVEMDARYATAARDMLKTDAAAEDLELGTTATAHTPPPQPTNKTASLFDTLA